MTVGNGNDDDDDDDDDDIGIEGDDIAEDEEVAAEEEDNAAGDDDDVNAANADNRGEQSGDEDMPLFLVAGGVEPLLFSLVRPPVMLEVASSALLCATC